MNLSKAVKRLDSIGLERALRAGAIVDERYYFFGDTLLINAVRKTNLAMVFDKNKVVNGVHIIIRLLQNNADVNGTNIEGSIPLIMACINNSSGLVELLLEKNANINGQNENGNTALAVASRSGYSELAVLLLEHGANINVQNGSGKTALEIAEQRGNLAVAKLIRAKRQEEMPE